VRVRSAGPREAPQPLPLWSGLFLSRKDAQPFFLSKILWA
jgi:hypothetical protein